MRILDLNLKLNLNPLVLAAIAGSMLPLTGQPVQTDVEIPVRNWQAPQYWMPSQQPDLTVALGSPLDKTSRQQDASPRLGSVTPLTGPLVFIGITPCRLVDTRTYMNFPAPFGPPALQPNEVRSFPLKSHPNCIIPPEAKAFSLNLLAISPGALSYLSAWPDGYPYPGTSFLNGATSGLYNNAVILAAGVNGGISVRSGSPADLIVDLNGYYVEISPGNRTLGGVIQSNGTAQSLPAGWTSARTGTGQYVISFPANTLPAGSSPAPVLSPIGAIATLQGASVVRLGDGSGTLTVVWSNDITFSFVLAPN
jgi:hypothetical protein